MTDVHVLVFKAIAGEDVINICDSKNQAMLRSKLANSILDLGNISFDITKDGTENINNIGTSKGSIRFDVTEQVDPKTDDQWQHYNGNVYTVIAIANVDDREDHPANVVYINVQNQKYYTKLLSIWHQKMTLVFRDGLTNV